MKEFLTYIILLTTLSSCCSEVYFESDETFWFDVYKKGTVLIFESNKGDLDTVNITNIIIKKPTGDCNPMVSTYDNEYVRVEYQMKKDTFNIINGWLIQHSAEPESKMALPVIRFLNMEYNEYEGSIKESKSEAINGKSINVFVFDKSNCGINYNQSFGLINFKWDKDVGLISYENSNGEIWSLKH